MSNVLSIRQTRTGSTIPPLEPGDHLDQSTFHQRYLAMPEDFNAELIGGIVFMQLPLSLPHGKYHRMIVHWLAEYEMSTPGTTSCDNITIILGPGGEPQPDATLYIEPRCGGQTRVEGEPPYLMGPPELIVEIASSSEAYDLHEKRDEYEKAGVREYVVVMIRDRRVAWFQLHEGKYRDMAAAASGIYKSEVFPGLWLNSEALLALDARRMIDTLREGLETEAHAAFVDRLSRSQA